MANYTYMLRCNDGSLYTGWTNDIDKRLRAHNEGCGAKYTKARRPVELVYLEIFETKEEAMRREAAIKKLSAAKKREMADAYQNPNRYYEETMYGVKRSGEKIKYTVGPCAALLDNLNLSEMMLKFFKEPDIAATKKTLNISLSKGGKKAEMKATFYLPDSRKASEFPKGFPVIICMHAIEPIQYAVDNGYAVAIIDATSIASDDILRQGCFYDLYPYGEDPQTQTGVLAAWGWGCSKVLDALYAGAGKELGIDPDMSIVTGVSRWGKATAVAAIYDDRFRMVVPTCSGAGGLALYNVTSTGKTYDLSSVGVGEPYTYGQNEPLSCLQSDAERGWFNDAFLKYKSPSAICVDQYMLAALGVNKDRRYLIVAACTGEDWVNAPSQNECYKRAKLLLAQKGLQDNIKAHFHKIGHAVILEDMKFIIAWFNKEFYQIESKEDLSVNDPFVLM